MINNDAIFKERIQMGMQYKIKFFDSYTKFLVIVDDYPITTWDLFTGKKLHTIQSNHIHSKLKFFDNSTKAISVTDDHILNIIDLLNGTILNTFTLSEDEDIRGIKMCDSHCKIIVTLSDHMHIVNLLPQYNAIDLNRDQQSPPKRIKSN